MPTSATTQRPSWVPFFMLVLFNVLVGLPFALGMFALFLGRSLTPSANGGMSCFVLSFYGVLLGIAGFLLFKPATTGRGVVGPAVAAVVLAAATAAVASVTALVIGGVAGEPGTDPLFVGVGAVAALVAVFEAVYLWRVRPAAVPTSVK